MDNLQEMQWIPSAKLQGPLLQQISCSESINRLCWIQHVQKSSDEHDLLFLPGISLGKSLTISFHNLHSNKIFVVMICIFCIHWAFYILPFEDWNDVKNDVWILTSLHNQPFLASVQSSKGKNVNRCGGGRSLQQKFIRVCSGGYTKLIGETRLAAEICQIVDALSTTGGGCGRMFPPCWKALEELYNVVQVPTRGWASAPDAPPLNPALVWGREGAFWAFAIDPFFFMNIDDYQYFRWNRWCRYFR